MGPEKYIYLSKFPHSDRENYWISFESDPRLSKTRGDIYHKCLPCIQSLYHQLQEKRPEITLGSAFSCWKIVVVLKSIEECIELLQQYEREFLRGHVYGKMGSGRSKSETRVVVFHTDDEKDRDEIYGNLKRYAAQVKPEAEIFVSRACAVLYEEILGDWREWKQSTPIRYPEKAGEILERIRKILYYSAM